MHEIHFETLDSTQMYAKKHKEQFPKNKITCIVTKEQTAGKGRYQRKWLSLKGAGLYVTFYFSLSSNTLHLTTLAQVMAVSLSSLLETFDLKPQIKWPNDVRINHKKISGILCEVEFGNNQVDIFLGVGVNLNLTQEEASQIDQPATSLFLETGKKWDREIVLKKLQNQFSKDLEKFKSHGFPPFREFLTDHLAFKGEKITCFDGTKNWEGILQSVTEDGRLEILVEGGKNQILSSGDIHK